MFFRSFLNPIYIQIPKLSTKFLSLDVRQSIVRRFVTSDLAYCLFATVLFIVYLNIASSPYFKSLSSILSEKYAGSVGLGLFIILNDSAVQLF